MKILEDKEACYAAFSAHDTRFDGRVFVCVSSTGIYCRPTCRVKMPKIENCSFHSSAASAEAAGFRPCLKCRPELAPGNSLTDASKRLIRKAALMIEEDALSDSNISNLAKSLDVTDRHLRRVFSSEFGVSPVQYLQTRRLLLAKNLLTDTTLSITDVALTAGFGSLRRFNDLFKDRYKLTPTALRKNRETSELNTTQGITLRLGYRPPFNWNQILSFLNIRAIPGVESVENNVYRRTVSMSYAATSVYGWLSVENDAAKNMLLLTLSHSLIPVIAKILVRIRVLFDLDCEPFEIYNRLSAMNEQIAGVCVPGTRLIGYFEPFEMSVRAVLGQQITLKAAKTLTARMATTYGKEIVTPYKDLTHVFPESKTICNLKAPIEDQLGPIGITKVRARSILSLAQAIEKGVLTLSQYANVEKEIAYLLTLPGIGPWTAGYIAMRAMSWPDAFLHTDYGIRKALHGMSQEKILSISESWRPWRSYAMMNLWYSL